MISFASEAKRPERSCVQLIEVKSTVFSEPVFCDLFSFTSWAIVSNQHCQDGCKGITLSRGNPWGRIESICLYFHENH